jgi:DNA-binding MarR family transcriptional regulator
MSQPEQYHGTALNEMISLVDIIREPTLARIYTFIRCTGPQSVRDIVDDLEIPERTAYEYVNKLVDAGFLQTTTDTRPAMYTANAIDLTLQADDETRAITPTFIAAIARREIDDDIDVYLDKHGVDGLATALDYTREYVDGTVNHRIMARELDLSPLEASIILQALRDIVAEERGE